MGTWFFWLVVVLFAWAVVTAAVGFSRWSRGGRGTAYMGTVFVVGLGFILLDGVVSDHARLVIVIPGLALLAAWRFLYRGGARTVPQDTHG